MAQARNLQIKRSYAIEGILKSLLINAVVVTLIILCFISEGFVRVIAVIGMVLMGLLFLGNFKELIVVWSKGIHIKK